MMSRWSPFFSAPSLGVGVALGVTTYILERVWYIQNALLWTRLTALFTCFNILFSGSARVRSYALACVSRQH